MRKTIASLLSLTLLTIYPLGSQAAKPKAWNNGQGWGASGGGRWGGSGGGTRWGSWGGGRGGSASFTRGAPSFQRSSAFRNQGFTRDIVGRQRFEMAPHHYYFHNFGGYRYWHFYDGRSLHWYGFYFGPRFFWFPFYAGYWWWWDVALARWVFWWDGYWWWYGPGNVAYVYADGNYTPYEQVQAQAQENAGASEAGGEPAAPPTAPPSAPSAPPAAAASASAAPASEGSSWTSPDGRRMVQIVGANGAAYLYNVSPGGKNPGFMKYLGEGIEKVRFAGGAQTQILVEYKDDTFAVFDADGSLVSGSAKPKEKAPAPAAPASKT